jgi:release factor glutamine methyltransferase
MRMTRLSAGPGDLTAAAAIAWAMNVLREAGVEGAARDARVLVSAATGLERLQFLNRPDAVLSSAQKAALEDVINRRFQREPVSRILGRRAFYGREFDISPHTLDPRQDSETLIDAALQLLEEDGVSRNEPLRIIDVGTGSGCLLITLLAELPNATGLGTDIEPEALRQAKLNASANDVASRADWSLARSLEGIDGPFDLLISNPPYIPTGDIQGLDREVRDYDPRSALDGGLDGLDIYREIANRLSTVVSRGWSIFEVGAGQANSVNEILAAADTPLIRVFRDLDGVDRCVARKARL